MTAITATYSPEDNKLRLKPATRLDAATYAKVKAAGFAWAPRQEQFVAPMWTPDREDLCIELAGEIEDEDTTLVDRAEERAERFAGYRENRTADGEAAQRAVAAIADNIPLGQPILVGHHSQRRAEKDAERIENGMRKAIKAFETADYWKHRAAGALMHARYKERPDVRHRRIKGLEADLRKVTKGYEESSRYLSAWLAEGLTLDMAKRIAATNSISSCFTLDKFPRNPPVSQYEGLMSLWSALEDGICSVQQAIEIGVRVNTRRIEWAKRWVTHYENRLTYERAMLGEDGGIAADRFDIAVGGRVLVRGDWVTVLRINKTGGRTNSLTTNRRYVNKVGIEEVMDYQPPTEEAAAAAAAVMKLPPMCNYEHESFIRLTQAEWKAIASDYKGSCELGAGISDSHRIDNAPFQAYGKHRVRSAVRGGRLRCVFITDLKVTLPPTPDDAPRPKLQPPERVLRQVVAPQQPEPNPAQALKDVLKAGIKAVSAPQLFPTPPSLAARMVDMLALADHDRVLEPSAGTGNLIRAIRDTGRTAHVVAIEVNRDLADGLARSFPIGITDECPQSTEVICKDFLGDLAIGVFDAIVMNPPFENGADIKHIAKAMTLLKPGGRLVAICAGGPRQEKALRPIVEECGGLWEPLPEGTFSAAGTDVRTVLLSVTNEEEP